MDSIFLPMLEEPIPEVIKAMSFIQQKVDTHNGIFHLDPRDINWKIFVFHQGEEWVICSNYEDGFNSTVFHDGEWFFREPWEGKDSIIRDDHVYRAIANHWLSYYSADF